MRGDLLSLDALDAAQLDRWSELAARAAEPNPFFERECVLPARSALAEEEEIMLLVALDDGGSWAACVPVRRMRGWHGVPTRCLASWRHPYCFLGTPLAIAETGREAFVALLGTGLEAPGSAFVGLDLFGTDGPVYESFREALVQTGTHLSVHAADRRGGLRRGTPAGIEAMSRKRRHDARRMARRLEELLGGALELRERSGDAAAIEDFLRLEAAGWKGRAGTAFASLPRHAEFFREMCREMDAQGRLELLSLEAGDRVVAMKCNLIAGGTVFTFKIAFDESLAEFSPGRQLDLLNIQRFEADDGLTMIDSCAEPTNQTINRMLPDRLGYANVALTAPGPRSWATRALVGTARATPGWVKRGR